MAKESKEYFGVYKKGNVTPPGGVTGEPVIIKVKPELARRLIFCYGEFMKIEFVLNKIPDVSYKDEILAMQPVILQGDLGKIK